LTKAQMMEDFDAAVTDRRLTLNLVERHLAGSAAEPSLLLGEYVCLLSGGSSGLRGLIVQTVSEYADFVGTINRRAMAEAMTPAGPPPGGLVIGIVGAGTPVHSSGLAAATAVAPPVRPPDRQGQAVHPPRAAHTMRDAVGDRVACARTAAAAA
jgi:phenylacetate-CoA ligase